MQRGMKNPRFVRPICCLLSVACCLAAGAAPQTVTVTVEPAAAVPPEIRRDAALYGQEPVRILYATLVMPLPSQKDYAKLSAIDERIVAELEGLTGFTHVALVTLSWQDRPSAVYHPLVRKAVSTLQAQGVHVIWGRWLWVAWPDGLAVGVPRPDPVAQWSADFYADAVSRLWTEAKVLGAQATLLDAEPYGACSQKLIVPLDVTAGERLVIADAIAEATGRAGAVDIILPTASNRSGWYGWSLAGLGLLRADNKTYYVANPVGKVVANPPDGFRHRLDLWGSNVGTGRLEDAAKLTVTQAKALDLEEIRRRWPECRGFWVYADHEILPDVLAAWKN